MIMELTDDNIRILSEYLSHTLSPDVNVRRPAEEFFESVEVFKNYPILLLNLIDKAEIDLSIRVAGSIAFKNYIKRNWATEEGCTDRIHEEDRNAIKTLIIDFMLKLPEAIQKQLSDAVSTIGNHDFPAKWPGLIDQMIEKFSSGEFHIINGVLQTAHSLLKKYRHEFKSQQLWMEFKFVLDKFAMPLTKLLKDTLKLTNDLKDDEGLKIAYSNLLVICKVFYSLNAQDLPEFFKDNMETWMTHFLTLLDLNVKERENTEKDEAGIVEKLKSQVCDNILLYAQKYDEEFRNYFPRFFASIKDLLVHTGPQAKYDNLVINALGFLTHVAGRHDQNNLFLNVLDDIFYEIVIPNLSFRESDEELFENNPEDFIRQGIEGCDADTRRKAACDLVRALASKLNQTKTTIFRQYVNTLLSHYSADPINNWKSKDAACYLVTSLVSRGQTERQGVTQTSQLVNLSDFAKDHIFTEFARPDVNSLPVLKADAIKYIIMFRSVLPKEVVTSCIPELIRHLTSTSVVVHTYAAAAIDKILLLKGPDNLKLIETKEILPLSEDLLKNLFTSLEFPTCHENEYIMKAILRSFQALQAAVIPYLEELLPKLTEKLTLVSKNPSKAHFNHYLFETLSLSIKIGFAQPPEAVKTFIKQQYPTFQVFLQQDEFIPYVRLVFSLLLEFEMNKTGRIRDQELENLKVQCRNLSFELDAYKQQLAVTCREVLQLREDVNELRMHAPKVKVKPISSYQEKKDRFCHG